MLPRLVRRGRAQRRSRRPDRAYGVDPLSTGILDDALVATLIAEFNDLASVEELFARTPSRSRPSSSSRSRTTSARCCRPVLPGRTARAHERPRRGAHLRRGDHRLPSRARRLPGDLRHHARSDHLGKAMGNGYPGRRARRQRRAHEPVQPRRRRRAAWPAPSTATRSAAPRRWRPSTTRRTPGVLHPDARARRADAHRPAGHPRRGWQGDEWSKASAACSRSTPWPARRWATAT